MALSHGNLVTTTALALAAQMLALTTIACAQQQRWLTQFGTVGRDITHALMPVDVGSGQESVIAAGQTGGDLGGLNAGRDDVFVARYDGDGNVVWINQFGSKDREWGVALAPDDVGGFFVAGSTEGNLAGPNSRLGHFDAFLARFDADGKQLWIRQFGSIDEDEATAVVSDGAGGVYVAGETNGDMDGINGTHIQWYDAWIARYDSAGNQLWLHQFGTPFASDGANALAMDGLGGVFIAGYTYADLASPSAGGSDIFLAHYESAGTQTWIRQFGSNMNERANAMIPDGQGGLTMTGLTGGDLGGLNAGLRDAFVARFDFAGEQIWLRQFGSSGFDEGIAIAADGELGTWITGYTSGGLGGSYDIFLALYDWMGGGGSVARFGTIGFDSAKAVAPVDGLGVIIAGQTRGDLAGKNAGSDDIFMARFDGGIYFCYAECDGNYVLDIFDFLCFQSAFVSNDPYACDCNTSTGKGVCDVFDFLCFQNAFVGGCP